MLQAVVAPCYGQTPGETAGTTGHINSVIGWELMAVTCHLNHQLVAGNLIAVDFAFNFLLSETPLYG
jgi:hypothetical protein